MNSVLFPGAYQLVKKITGIINITILAQIKSCDTFKELG